MKILKGFARAAAVFSVCALWALAAATAAVPERISYQGTLRKDGILFSGAVPMEFMITNSSALTTYWTSGSTSVVVSGGLFRYPLGIPNESQYGKFTAIDWNSVDAYVLVMLDGTWLPLEPLFSSAYALHAKTANSSLGDFTVRDGSIRLSTTTGNIGLVFQDGTTQYTSASPVWTVTGADVYISSVAYGNAGIGNSAPQARLDVQSASGGVPQIWRDSSGVITASMTAAGFLHADGSQLRNLPPSADNLGSHIATQTVNLGGFQLSNAGAVTASSYTAGGALGMGAAQVRLANSVIVSSETSAALGAGVRVSSNVYIMGFSSATKYYGDGSAIANLPIPANIMTLDTNQIVSGVKTVTSSFTVTSANGIGAARMRLAGNIDVSSTSSAALGGGVSVSSNIYIVGFSSAAKYYGDGSLLTGITFLPVLSQNMIAGSYWYSGDGGNEGVRVDATGKVSLGGSGISPTGTVDVRATSGVTYAQVWRNIGGTDVSSMTVGGVLYADGSGLRNTMANPALRDLNMAGYSIVSVSTVSVSSITSSGAGVVISTNLFIMNGNVGISTGAPQQKLHVNGSILSTSLVGVGNRCAYVDNAGVLRAKAGDCGTSTGGDEMGLHVMTQNLETSGFYIINSGGGSNGIFIDASNNVGIGAGVTSPSARLDVKASGTAQTVMAQSWHDSAGIVIGSMSATGVMKAAKFVGSGAGLTDIGDSFGSHTATKTVNMAGFGLLNVASMTGTGFHLGTAGAVTASSYTASSALGIGAAQVSLANNILISSWSVAAQGGGVRISSNVYIVGFASATRYYGDGSGLTGVAAASGGGDSLGTHIATKTLTMAGYDITGGRDIIGVSTVTLSSIAASGAQITMSSPLSMAGRNITDVYSLTVSSITSPGTEVVLKSDLQVTGALDVRGGGIRIGNTSVTNSGMIRWSGLPGGFEGYNGVGWVALNGTYYVDVSTINWGQGLNNTIYSQSTSSNVSIGFTDSGLTNKLRVRGETSNAAANALLAENSGGTALFVVRNDGNVGVGTANPAVELDVNGTVNASAYTGDGSALTGTGDDLGSHTASNVLDMNSYALINAGAVTASSYTATSPLGVGAPQVRFANNVAISSGPASALGGGLQISSNVYIIGFASATRFYGDGSGLTGVAAASGGGDSLGAHIATQTLNMAGYDITGGRDIIGVSTISVSSITSAGGTVTLSANLVVAGGSIQSSNFAGFNSRCVHVNNFGVFSITADDCGSATGMDGMGDHVMLQNLRTNGKWITGDEGSADGLMLDSSQNLGVGQGTPEARLDVFGPGGGGTLTQIWRNSAGAVVSSMSAVGTLKAVKFLGDGAGLTGISFSPILTQNLQAGAYWLSGDGGNEGLAVDSGGNVGVNVAAPMARLDVKAGGSAQTDMAQIWRNSGNTIVSSVSATGVMTATRFVGDGSGLTGVTGNDGLGNHTATQDLKMAGFQITNAGAVTASSYTATNALGIGAAQVRLGSNVLISSWAVAAQGGGVRISSNVYMIGFASATKFYGDGSALTGVVGLDNLGNHTATQNLNMSGKDIISVSTISVSSITSPGGSVGVNTDLVLRGSLQSTTLAGLGDKCLYVNNAGIVTRSGGECGTVAGNDNMGNQIMTKNLVMGGYWLSYDGSNSGITVNISSNVGIGVASALTRLDVQPATGDTYSQIWRTSGGTIVASMTATGKLFADGSALTGVVTSGADSLGTHIATQTLNMSDFPILNAPQIQLGGGIIVSSEAAAALGAGLRVSSNVYIMGFSSATKYYGDGSGLTGVAAASGGGDSLGTHVATKTLTMGGFEIVGVSTLTVTTITSSGWGVLVSTNIYADKYYGNGAQLSGLMGNPAAADLTMTGFSILNGISASFTDTVTTLKLALGSTVNKTVIQIAAKPTGGIDISTPTYLTSFLVLSSHSVTGNNATSVLANTAVLVNEAYAEADITSSIIGLTAIALSSPTAPHTSNAMVIGGNFRGGIVSGNAQNYDTLVGLKGGSWNQTSGQVTNAIGIKAQNEQTNGTLINNYGIFVDTPIVTLPGTMTNNYGIYIRDHSGMATNNFNLFSKGLTAKNVFEGMVAIGDTSLSTPAQDAPLEIKASNTNSAAIRIDHQSSTNYCYIKLLGSQCNGGVDGSTIAVNGGYYLCLKCQ